MQERKNMLDNKILILEKDNVRLTNEDSMKRAEIKELDDDINHKNIHKKELRDEILTLETSIEDHKNEREELKKGNRQLHKEICKEHYTLWNWEFLTNNKNSAFTSLVLALLMGASWPLLFKILSPIQSNYENKHVNNIKETHKQPCPSRLEHLSDDEDSEMVPSSSVLPKPDLKYNYDRDCMEENDDPDGCLKYIKNKYDIKRSLKHCWEALQPSESIEMKIWKTQNDELIFTKLMLKKVLNNSRKTVLTFELFQTKLKDAFSYTDYEETDLQKNDLRIEAQLAWKIN